MSQQRGKKRKGSDDDSKTSSPSRRESVVDLRIEEKKELSSLNKRLELIIIAQRERAAAEGSLSSQLDLLKREKRGYEKEKRQSDKLLQEKDGLLEEKKQLEDTVVQLKKKLAAAEVLLDQEKTLREAEKRDRDSKIKELKEKLASVREEKRSLTDQLDVTKQENIKLTRELREVNENLQQRIEEATKGEQARIERLSQDLDRERTLSGEYKRQLSAKEADLLTSLTAKEIELRNEFGKQLKEHLAERQKFWENETQKIRDLHEQKIKEKNDQLDTLHDKLRSAADTRSKIEQTVTEVRSQLRVSKTEAKAARDEKDALEKEVTELQRELTVVKTEFTKNEKLLIDEQEKYRKEHDRAADLESANQTLEIEIKAYRLLLEDEENRLGLAKVRFHGFSLDENYFELKNTSFEDISLKGWTVQSRETGKRLDLPDRILKKDEVLKVWIGLQPASAPGDITWDEDVWDATKVNALQLFDPRDVEVSNVEATPDGEGEEDVGEQ